MHGLQMPCPSCFVAVLPSLSRSPLSNPLAADSPVAPAGPPCAQPRHPNERRRPPALHAHRRLGLPQAAVRGWVLQEVGLVARSRVAEGKSEQHACKQSAVAGSRGSLQRRRPCCGMLPSVFCDALASNRLTCPTRTPHLCSLPAQRAGRRLLPLHQQRQRARPPPQRQQRQRGRLQRRAHSQQVGGAAVRGAAGLGGRQGWPELAFG